MAGTWFKRVVWLGIFANFALAVPTLLVPARMVELTGIPPASPLLWVQFSGLLLILLSIFYMPAGIDYVRYRATAWSSVGSRLAGVIFFVGFQSREYHMFGYFDLVFLVPEAILLTMALRSTTDRPEGLRYASGSVGTRSAAL
jgi:hypothetical protein